MKNQITIGEIIPKMKTYTEKQVLQLLDLKDATIKFLTIERGNLETRVSELSNRVVSINQALNLIQSLTDSNQDLAVFEHIKLS